MGRLLQWPHTLLPQRQAVLQELRVQLFAQELGVKGGVSPKRLAARLERLRSA